MADDAKIRIPIDIPPGDVSGAQVARQEIDQTVAKADGANAEQAALEKQRAEDVIEARRRVADRRVEEQTREINAEKELQQTAQDSARARIAAGAALAASSRQIAALTVDVIRQYKELGVELGSFEQIGLDFADFLTSPFDFVADAFTDYKADLAALKQSQLDAVRQEAIYQETLAKRDRLLAAASERRINTYLAGEQAAVDEQTAALERQLRVVDAIAKAEEARAKAADAIALANGADPNTVAAGAAARAAAAGGVQEDRRVQAAQQEVENAVQVFENLRSALARANADPAATQARIDELSAQTQAAQDAIGNAQAELETIRTEAAAAKTEIAAGAVAEFQGLATAAADANTQAAEDAKAALEAQAAEQGANFTAGGREALRILTEALADGVIKPEEIGAVTQAIQQAKNASTRLNAAVIDAFTVLEATNATTAAALGELLTRSQNQQRQIEELYRRIGEN